MFEFDIEDDDSFDFSVFDRAKIEDLSIDEKMEAESGSFMVIRQKNGYHIYSARGKNTGVFVSPNLEKVFNFLENN